MTIGFTVDALVARARGGGALRMGLSRVGEADWLFPAPDLALRRETFDAHPAAVIELPEAEAAGREVAAMLGVAGGLADAARATWEDLCVLTAGSDGHVLTGAAVAFPTDWRVEEKIGLPVTAIHAPIHGYAEQLAAGVDHFLATLTPGPIYARGNWFVVADPAWRYLPTDLPERGFAHVTAANAGTTLFVRCERQTLRRLRESGAVLFTIGVAVERLDRLASATVARVAQSVAAVPEGERERRAAPGYADALAAYAASLGLERAA